MFLDCQVKCDRSEKPPGEDCSECLKKAISASFTFSSQDPSAHLHSQNARTTTFAKSPKSFAAESLSPKQSASIPRIICSLASYETDWSRKRVLFGPNDGHAQPEIPQERPRRTDDIYPLGVVDQLNVTATNDSRLAKIAVEREVSERQSLLLKMMCSAILKRFGQI